MRIVCVLLVLAGAVSPALAVDTFPTPTCDGQSCQVQPNFPGVDERSQEVRESERCIVLKDGTWDCRRVDTPKPSKPLGGAGPAH